MDEQKAKKPKIQRKLQTLGLNVSAGAELSAGKNLNTNAGQRTKSNVSTKMRSRYVDSVQDPTRISYSTAESINSRPESLQASWVKWVKTFGI